MFRSEEVAISHAYHAVPDKLTGTVLQPLATLKTTAPELYEAAIAKYDDDPSRRNIPRRHVAKLDCAYEECINLSPLNPRLIHQHWKQLGVNLGSARWYAIPIDNLRGLPAVVTIPHRQTKVGQDIGDDAVSWLDLDQYQELTQLPDKTVQWYSKLASDGTKGAWFVGVPHILVRGSISVTGLRPTDWSHSQT